LPGIQAAKAGGFDVFGFATGRNKDAFEELGAKVFFGMDELETLLLIK
jgi:beta-phosphoglucomutase-like phosphatase (HAD superfamily)